MKLTIYFDGSLWCGLIELDDDVDSYCAIHHIFGAEPKDSEVLTFIDQQLPALLVDKKNKKMKPSGKKISPKRMQRLINREKRQPVLSTKAQQALQETRELHKSLRKSQRSARKEQLAQERFEKRQLKKREKHKGH